MKLPLDRIARPVFWVSAIVVLHFAVFSVPKQVPLTGWDKANHVMAFAVLAVSGLVGWNTKTRTVVVGLLLYGLAIEVVQLLTPDRVFELRDLAADAVGILAGWCVLKVCRRAGAPLPGR